MIHILMTSVDSVDDLRGTPPSFPFRFDNMMLQIMLRSPLYDEFCFSSKPFRSRSILPAEIAFGIFLPQRSRKTYH